MLDGHIERVEQFRAALITHDEATLIDRYYQTQPAAALEITQEASLRRAIADHHRVQLRDVVVVGSAKLGFTLRPKPGRPALSSFSDISDIDVAIISSSLFLSLWKRIFDYAEQHDDWSDGPKFREFLQRGWLRPDKLPRNAEFPERRQWFEFFQGLTDSGRFGPYKIAAGIYYDEDFWSKYTKRSLLDLRMSEENN